MSWHRVAIIVRKEWLETLHNRTIIITFVGLAAMFTLLPLVLAFAIPSLSPDLFSSSGGPADVSDVPPLFQESIPNVGQLSSVAQFQVFMLRQFLVFFLILPVMGAISIATFSIIGEKTSRSLEALLATPVRTDELLLGKTLASSVPTVVATWIAFALFACLVLLLGGPEVARLAIDATSIIGIAVMVPLIALLGLGLGVIVSSRAKDPRSAQQVAGIVVLPLVVLIVGQSAGLFIVGPGLVLAGAFGLLVMDAVVLAAGVKLFDREAILTRWK